MRFPIGLVLLATTGIAVIATIVDVNTPGAADGLFTFVGMSYLVFGTWAGVLLVKK